MYCPVPVPGGLRTVGGEGSAGELQVCRCAGKIQGGQSTLELLIPANIPSGRSCLHAVRFYSSFGWVRGSNCPKNVEEANGRLRYHSRLIGRLIAGWTAKVICPVPCPRKTTKRPSIFVQNDYEVQMLYASAKRLDSGRFAQYGKETVYARVCVFIYCMQWTVWQTCCAFEVRSCEGKRGDSSTTWKLEVSAVVLRYEAGRQAGSDALMLSPLRSYNRVRGIVRAGERRKVEAEVEDGVELAETAHEEERKERNKLGRFK